MLFPTIIARPLLAKAVAERLASMTRKLRPGMVLTGAREQRVLSLRECHYPDLRDYRYPAFLDILSLETIFCKAIVWVPRPAQVG